MYLDSWKERKNKEKLFPFTLGVSFAFLHFPFAQHQQHKEGIKL